MQKYIQERMMVLYVEQMGHVLFIHSHTISYLNVKLKQHCIPKWAFNWSKYNSIQIHVCVLASRFNKIHFWIQTWKHGLCNIYRLVINCHVVGHTYLNSCAGTTYIFKIYNYDIRDNSLPLTLEVDLETKLWNSLPALSSKLWT